MDYRSLEASELEAWLDHCGRVFAPMERAYFARHFHSDPWHDHRDILVAVEGGQILSSVRVFTRQISIQGQALSMGGIGEVATAPEGRGKGLAGVLLERALALMAERGMVVSALFGTHSNYQRLGWQSVPLVLKNGPIPIGNTEFSCAPLRPDDLPALIGLHQSYNRNHDGWVVRSDARYWRDWFLADPSDKWLARDNRGDVVAYLAAVHKKGDMNGKDTLVVYDFAAAPAALAAFDALVAAVASALPEEKKPASVRYPACISSASSVQEISYNEAMMFRLIKPFSLGKQRIDTTAELAAALQSGTAKANRSLVFWYLDGF